MKKQKHVGDIYGQLPSLSKKELHELQQRHYKDHSLLEYFDDDLCDLMCKYINVNHGHRDDLYFYHDKEFIHALVILTRFIKKTYERDETC
jgi:hypothetical protein